MTNKIMELVDQYVSDKVLDAECGYETNGDSGKSYAELSTEVQAHIDYTRAVIAERDVLRKAAQMALDVLENEGVTYWTNVQDTLRKELGL